MSVRSARRIWLVGLWLLLPWPMLVYSDAWVPAARYAILAAAASAVFAREGGGGVVPLLVAVFVGQAAATALACWGLARVAVALLARAPGRTLALATWGVLLAGLAAALWLEPYHTVFGRVPRGGLLEILS